MSERYLNYFKRQKVYGLNDTCYINRKYKRFDDNIIPNHTNLIRHNKIHYVVLEFGDLHDCSKIIRTLWRSAHKMPNLYYFIDEKYAEVKPDMFTLFTERLLILMYYNKRRHT